MLKYWILGMLVKKPRSGYALRKRAFEPLQPDLSTIYRTLSGMMKQGLVSCDKIEQEKLPAQKVYTVTKKGRDELEDWLRTPLLSKIERDPFLTQLWLSSNIENHQVIENIKAYADEAKRQMKWLQTEAKKIVHKSAGTSDYPIDELHRNLVLDCDIAQLEARIEWSNSAIKAIKAFKHPSRKQHREIPNEKPPARRKRHG
jgi:PadR family transcriptional regulator, regulatory protein AphA